MFILPNYFLSAEVKMLSKGECLALIIENKMTQQEYQIHRNIAKNTFNADIYQPYQKVMEFRDKECTPPNIDYSNAEHEITVPMESMIHHQLDKLFKIEVELTPKLVTFCEANPGIIPRLSFKWGMYFFVH